MYTYTSRQTPRNESSVFSYPCRYKHLWKHFFFFSKLRARKSLIQDICDSLRVTARNLSTYIKVSFEMKFFFLCSYKAITQRMLLDIDKTAIYLKKISKVFLVNYFHIYIYDFDCCIDQVLNVYIYWPKKTIYEHERNSSSWF